jgi:hypothetical protein
VYKRQAVVFLFLLYGSGQVLMGVRMAGVSLGGQSETEAAQTLAVHWQDEGLLLRDPASGATWAINPQELGLNLDAEASAAYAQDWGRGRGGLPVALTTFFNGATLKPILVVDLDQAARRLEELRPLLETPPRNAGVELRGGQVLAIPAHAGTSLDIDATLERLATDAAGESADGVLEIVLVAVPPVVTDATPLVAEAQALLSRPFVLDIYDPVTDESLIRDLAPAEWGAWLVATPDPASTNGLALTFDRASLQTYLETYAPALGETRYLNMEESLARLEEALAQKTLQTWIRVYHRPTTYEVQRGETLASIGYALGIPYPWIQAINPGVEGLSAGQILNIPSLDDLLPLPVIRHKRIVVSISQQAMWAYENGALKWHWRVSTGIARSPTSPGIFQIQSHEVNAYAAQWDLYMPYFMGVYQPGPNAGVMNGFHGFPTSASGGYLLWTDDLGRPATYGCILLSLENAEQLYTWAEEGVVVQILP